MHAPFLLSRVACLAPPYFFTLSHKQHDFLIRTLWNIKCVLIFSTIFVSNVAHSKNNSTRCYYIYKHFLSRFNKTLIFFDKIKKNPRISDLIKCPPVRAQLLRANGRTHGRTDGRTDGKTDMTKLILAFRNFANKHNDNNTVNKKKTFLYTDPLYNADCECG